MDERVLCRCGAKHFRVAQRWVLEQHGGEVNAPEVNPEAPAEVNPMRARGAYPNTDSRREYMRNYMRDRRSLKGA